MVTEKTTANKNTHFLSISRLDRLSRLLGIELNTKVIMFTGFIEKLSDLLVLFNRVAQSMNEQLGLTKYYQDKHNN